MNEVVIAPPSQWLKETLNYSDFTADATTNTKTAAVLLHNLPVGAIPRRVIVRPISRFTGTGLGQVTLDIVDENGTSMISSKVNLCYMDNPRYYTNKQMSLAAMPASGPTNSFPVSMNVILGQAEATASTNTQERSLITVLKDTANSLDGKYFTIGTSRYVWYSTSGGSAVDPAPGGAFVTAIRVNITTGDTAAVVGYKTAKAIAATFDTSFDGVSQILVIDSAVTNVTNVGAGNSGFTVSVEQAGAAAPAAISALAAGQVEVMIELMNIA